MNANSPERKTNEAVAQGDQIDPRVLAASLSKDLKVAKSNVQDAFREIEAS